MNEDKKYSICLDIARSLRSLVDLIEALADTCRDVSGPKVIEAQEVKELPKVSLEEVRAVLASKSQNGKTADVKKLIAKYGANKLSEVPPEHYAALIKDAEVLGDE